MSPKEAELTAAVAALKKFKVVEEGVFASEFNGYIASLGASIIQSGLLPTWVNFSERGSAAQDRTVLLYVLFSIAYPGEPNGDLFEMYTVLKDHWKQDRNGTESRLMSAAIAAKMALRLFKKRKES